MSTRGFTGAADCPPPERNVADAPGAMRVEFIDIAFALAEQLEAMNHEPDPHTLYLTIAQTLGILAPAHQPNNGLRLRSQEYLVAADWRRFYDVVLRVWQMFDGRQRTTYRHNVDALLAAHGIVWQMTDGGKLVRVLPAPLAGALKATIDELRRPGYEAARALFDAALDAFNDRPRRDRDAVANAFDTMEAAGKIRFALPAATFGAVLTHVQNNHPLNADVRAALWKLNDVRNHQFGHGTPFTLTPAEVDFAYVTCAAGARLFMLV